MRTIEKIAADYEKLVFDFLDYTHEDEQLDKIIDALVLIGQEMDEYLNGYKHSRGQEVEIRSKS